MKNLFSLISLLFVPVMLHGALKRKAEGALNQAAKKQEASELPMHIDWRQAFRKQNQKIQIMNFSEIVRRQDIPAAQVSFPQFRNTQSGVLKDERHVTVVRFFSNKIYKELEGLAQQMAKSFNVDISMLKASHVYAYYEYQIMHTLKRYPNIVPLIGFVDPIGPNAVLVYKYIEGETLQQLLNNASIALSLKDQLYLALGITSGLEHIHQAGFNLRPDSGHIQVEYRNKEWFPVICAAHRIHKGTETSPMKCWEHNETVAVTPLMIRTIVPEDRKIKILDPKKSDIFCLGTVIWQIATRKIHAGGDRMVVMQKIFARETLPIPDNVDPLLKEIITRCWNFYPDKRPTAAEIVAILQQRLDQIPATKAASA